MLGTSNWCVLPAAPQDRAIAGRHGSGFEWCVIWHRCGEAAIQTVESNCSSSRNAHLEVQSAIVRLEPELLVDHAILRHGLQSLG